VKTASQRLERFSVELLSTADSEEKKYLKNVIKEERVRKVDFDSRVTAWLEAVGLRKKELKAVMAQPPPFAQVKRAHRQALPRQLVQGEQGSLPIKNLLAWS